tara:strand:+ start:2861 stop:3001 length:141 start_codon:yes stop_codon:yes gene_type:complete
MAANAFCSALIILSTALALCRFAKFRDLAQGPQIRFGLKLRVAPGY